MYESLMLQVWQKADELVRMSKVAGWDVRYREVQAVHQWQRQGIDRAPAGVHLAGT